MTQQKKAEAQTQQQQQSNASKQKAEARTQQQATRPWGGIGVRRKIETGGTLFSGIVVDAKGGIARYRTRIDPDKGEIQTVKVGVVSVDEGIVKSVEPQIVGSRKIDRAAALRALDEAHHSSAKAGSKLSTRYLEKIQGGDKK